MICNFHLCIATQVAMGSDEQLIPIFIGLIFAIGLILYANKYLNQNQKWRIVHIFAIFISLIVTAYHIHKIFTGGYDISKDLPLYLCSLLGILIPVFTYFKKYWMFEILVFWIIAGTLQAVLTPDIKEGFPSFEYFRYWIVHLGLLTVIFFVIFVFKWKPTFKSIFKSFAALQIYVLLMILINSILKSNYFYLNEKPQSASLLDYFGEWPWYIVVVQIIVIPYFMLIYLPFYISAKRAKKTNYLANN